MYPGIGQAYPDALISKIIDSELEYEANSSGNIGIKNTEINTHNKIIKIIKFLKEIKKLLDIIQTPLI